MHEAVLGYNWRNHFFCTQKLRYSWVFSLIKNTSNLLISTGDLLHHLDFVFIYKTIKSKTPPHIWSSRIAKDKSIRYILDVLFKDHFQKCHTAILHFFKGGIFFPKGSVPQIHSQLELWQLIHDEIRRQALHLSSFIFSGTLWNVSLPTGYNSVL